MALGCSSQLYGLNDNVHLRHKSAGSNRGNEMPRDSAGHGAGFGRSEPEFRGRGTAAKPGGRVRYLWHTFGDAGIYGQ